MAIEKKLICFARLEEFQRQLAAGNIKDYSIVLIQDAKKIYNRGTYYDCNNVIPDWNVAKGEDGYVKNKTHYRTKGSFLGTHNAATMGNIVLGAQLPILIINETIVEDGPNQREIIVEKLDTEFNVPSVGPSIKAKITYDGTNYIYEQLTAFGVSNSLQFYTVLVKPLQDWFIPNTIVRKTDLATINGQSLTAGGDITIEGGSADNVYITDFTVNDLLSIAGQPAAIQGDVPRLYDAVVAHKLILVPYDTDEGFHGYGVAVGYYEDMIYLTVLLGAELIELELNPNIDEIGGEQVTSRSWYDKQDRLVSGTNIKTINGTSILGSGNIEIESGGEANVKSDWLETNSDSDSYVKNRTHYVAGTKITSAGSYSIGASTPIYYREKVYNLEIGVRTQIDSNASGVYVTLNDGGILRVESFSNYLETFPIIAVSEIVPLDDMFIPETIARTSELKTINGESIVGSGDIEISASESFWYDEGDGNLTTDNPVSLTDVYIRSLSTSENGSGNPTYGVSGQVLTTNGERCYWADAPSGGGSGAYSEVNHGTSDTTFTLTPNTFHVWDEVASLTLDFGSETSGVANEFLFQFTSGSTATSLTLPDDIKWANDSAPTIEANMIYQVSVLKGLASVLSWENAKIISFTVSNTTFYAEEGMTWQQFIYSEYNSGGFAINYSEVKYNSGSVALNSTRVNISDIIISNGNYNIVLDSGGAD